MREKKADKKTILSDYSIQKQEERNQTGQDLKLEEFFKLKRDVFRRMLEIQFDLNVKTNGKAWFQGKTEKGLVINWDIALYTEIGELIESFNWKHWKNDNLDQQYLYDKENLIVETVDILHFILSLVLEKMTKLYTIPSDKSAIVEKALEYIESGFLMKVVYDSTKENKKIEPALLIEDAMDLVSCGYKSNVKKIPLLLNHFMRLVVDINHFQKFSLMDLYKSYVCKSFLNEFRQLNGYKEGTYKKHIFDTEDNIIAFGLMHDFNTYALTHNLESVKKAWFSNMEQLYKNWTKETCPKCAVKRFFKKFFK